MPPKTRVSQSPQQPAVPGGITPAGPDSGVFDSEASYWQLSFTDQDLSRRVAELVEFEQCRLTSVDLSGTSLDRARLTDCVVERSNLANLRTTGSTLRRVELSASRATGLQWIDGVLQDVALTECRFDLCTFRFSKFKDVVFTDCNLSRADFTNADLRGARFAGCDLTGAQFHNALMDGTVFSRCDLAELGGVTSFAGARVEGQDLVALSYTLADALGIVITE
ncbi:pentapeptide repeat-containing protein [Longispora sp. NPDC051575]|uniref:pentapeptide repeat-containing protein n=1 Tax=Longispora sp. NPDC051575 TaxID=3154943 RepID=UPI00344A1D9D